MTTHQQKTRPVRTGGKDKSTSIAAPAPKMEEAKTKAAMAKEPRLAYSGIASSTYRVGKKLTPLRTNYRAGDMSQKDNEFLREVLDTVADKDGEFQRRNIDAGRLGRLYTLGFVTYDEIGVVDPKQTIRVTDKAREFVKPVRAA